MLQEEPPVIIIPGVPGSTNPNIGFLLPGTYTVTITDANNCSITDSAEILPGENPTLDVTIENVTCFGDNDGMIYISAIGELLHIHLVLDGGITFVPSRTPLPNRWCILFYYSC